MENEIWRDVIGFEGIYQASTLGRIRSLSGKYKSKENIILKPSPDKDGYLRVRLYLNKNGKSFRVNRLIALTFIPNPLNKPMVNHKDGIKNNDSLENLEWVTQGENEKHAYRTGLKSHKGESHPYHKLTQQKVDEIRNIHNKGGITHGDIAKMFNISTSQITRIVNHINW